MLESNLKILPLACTLSSCVWVTDFSDWWGSNFSDNLGTDFSDFFLIEFLHGGKYKTAVAF
jgi:hypothetical protein